MSHPLPPERWVTVEKLFVAATELPVAERETFVITQCGDDRELRDELISLLRSDTREDPGLLAALRDEAANVLVDEPPAGRMLGPWRIERELGRGGMSVVYLASRADGEFRKSVAIKLIKRGMDTDLVVARMRRERGILAALDHPSIARLLDGGTTPHGLPWIAMEYVEGAPIDRCCEENGLGINQRCELIIKVCDAVAYAHRNLVVHGDLKPGNILVAPDGNPKLLDFGIAKLLGPGDKEEISGIGPMTRGLMRPFTPEYASPEQMGGGTIGTATDVYSLGAVLFELLTGVRPRGGAEKASAAALRTGKGKRWARRLKGDLDNVLQMTLRIEPERRYLSIGQFALDLRRHLQGLPVGAREETLAYRWSKFLLRHRIGAVTALVLLMIATLGAGLYINQARLAEKRFEELRHFAHAFLFDVDDQLRTMPESTRARELVAETALDYLNGLAVEKSGDRQLRREAGNAWRRLGDLQGGPTLSSLGDSAGARKSYERSLALLDPLARAETGRHTPKDARSDLIASYLQLALLERITGNTAVSASLYLKVLPVARQVGTPPDPELQAVLGLILSNYGEALTLRGTIPEAKRQATQAIALLEAAAAANARHLPELADALSALGAAERQSQDWASALEHHRRSLAIRQKLAAENPESRSVQRDLMLAWSHLGDLFMEPGSISNPSQGLSSYEQMLAIAKERASSDPSDTTARRDVAISLERVAEADAATGAPRPAIAAYEESMAMLGELQKTDRNSRQIDEYNAISLLRIGEQYLKLGQLPEGRDALKKCIDLSAKILARDSDAATNSLTMLLSLEDLADSLAGTRERAAAIGLVARIESTARGIAARGTTQSRRIRMPEALEKIGSIYEKLGEPATAMIWYQRSLEEWTALAPLSRDFKARPERVKARIAAIGDNLNRTKDRRNIFSR